MLKSIENGKQTILDVGQKGIGMEHCVKCGMVYSLETPSDVKQHERFHNRFTETANFRVSQTQIEQWKSVLQHENVESPLPGILFGVRSTSTATLKRKLETIITNFVNTEIGYAPDLPVWDAHGKRKGFVFVSTSKPPYVGGLLLVDPVTEVILMPEGKRFKSPKIGLFLGVDRIWVHSHLRRKGLATWILDAARRLLSPKDGDLLRRSRVAFGDPNELCVKLAINYVEENKDKNSPNTTSPRQHNRYIAYSHT
uniref:N-acetyltransferase ECO1 n=1 Tax=Meloidogyne incognita TaxID=6306 RepID=A0A914LF61_MELIC